MRTVPKSWSHWLCAWGAIDTLGVCTALLTGQVVSVLALGGATGLGAAVATVAHLWPAGRRPALQVLSHLRLVGIVSVFTGASAVALAVAAQVSAGLFFLLLLTAATTCPAVLARMRRWTDAIVGNPRSSTSPGTAPLSRPAVQSLKQLTTPQLCSAWRHSFQLLQDASTPAGVSRVAQLRQVYLDEMERRDASAFNAWLASGARASSGPDRYLAEPQGPDSTPDAA